MLKLARRSFIAACAGGAPLARRPGAFAQEATVDHRRSAGARPARREVARPGRRAGDGRRICLDELPALRAFRRDDVRRFPLKYVDTGKVRYIFREFPLNAPAFAVAMVARCAPADQFFDVIHTYFRPQDKWLSAADLKAAILEIAKAVRLHRAKL